MARDLVGAVASAVVERLLAAKSGSLPRRAAEREPDSASLTTTAASDIDPWLVDCIVDAMVSNAATAAGGAEATEADALSALVDTLTNDDIEAIASQVVEELAPLFERKELPADKIEI